MSRIQIIMNKDLINLSRSNDQPNQSEVIRDDLRAHIEILVAIELDEHLGRPRPPQALLMTTSELRDARYFS